MARRQLALALALSLLTGALCRPALRRDRRQSADAEDQTSEVTSTAEPSPPVDKPEISNEVVPPVPYSDDDDDDDGFEPMTGSASRGAGDGGSNVFSLLRIAGAILPSSSNAHVLIRNTIRQFLQLKQPPPVRRQFVHDNRVEFDYIPNLKPPPFQRQEDSSNESDSRSRSESDESGGDAAEQSAETANGNNPKEDSGTRDASVAGNDSDDESDEPPGGGDGQGGGILGLLAGLSGGEDGQSDLGSLLATISGIVANLSGDGIDLNALIASGIGLFVGLLSEGEQNPGAVIASYLLTSLDTVTGGGSKNNGEFFGTFLSRLVKGTSAVGDSEESSGESGDKMNMSDSTGFLVSLVAALLGDMSKGSSGHAR